MNKLSVILMSVIFCGLVAQVEAARYGYGVNGNFYRASKKQVTTKSGETKNMLRVKNYNTGRTNYVGKKGVATYGWNKSGQRELKSVRNFNRGTLRVKTQRGSVVFRNPRSSSPKPNPGR